jgi:hypothetical protein
MATNDYEIQVNTDDYDEFLYGGEPESLPGSPVAIDEQGHLVIPSDGWLVHQSHDPSVMDPENTGATTDFWSAYPITIDINGNIFYYGENTGINVRGPAGETNIIQWDDLTPEQIELLKGEKGQDGAPGTPGTNGTNGANGKSAYELWLEEGHSGTINDFLNSLIGEAGKSAFEIWLELGHEGTVVDFIDYIKGQSAYELWIQEGHSGTEEEFLESLVGPSNYDLWIDAGYEGSVDDYLLWLRTTTWGTF